METTTQWFNENIDRCNSCIDEMKRYLGMKVAQEDWHGVADAAMDLRDLYNQRDAYRRSAERYQAEQPVAG